MRICIETMFFRSKLFRYYSITNISFLHVENLTLSLLMEYVSTLIIAYKWIFNFYQIGLSIKLILLDL